jgi:hypothetical protein
MVVPNESITYGWGKKYKSMASIFYDKLKDIEAHRGEKDYLLKHYNQRDKRTGVTRFELRIMKEMIKQTKQTFSPVEVDHGIKRLGNLLKKGLSRIKITDPKYPKFHQKIESEIDRYFDVDIPINSPRVKQDYDFTMMTKQMIGIASSILYKSARYREIAENLDSPELMTDLMQIIFREALHNPHGLTKCNDLFVRIQEEKQIRENPLKTRV